MRENGEFRSGVISVLKGAFFALIVTLAGILIFAGVLKISGLTGAAIKPVNQFIKAVALFLGCFFSVKGKAGFLKGGITGIVYILLTHLVFALFFGESLGVGVLLDLAFGGALGILSGIICVNVKKGD